MKCFTLRSKNCMIYMNNIYEMLNIHLQTHKYSNIIIFTDSNTNKYCLPIFIKKSGINNFKHINIQPGDKNKNIDTCIIVWKYMLDNKINRNSLLINLGGGVITDIGGFIASTYKRGIDFINIPTTLLSQIDASIGEKTGFNLYNVKNCIGLFKNPVSVYIDIIFLKTLKYEHILSGFAEMIKHGLIYDKEYYYKLKRIVSLKNDVDYDIIYESLNIKNNIIMKDIYENNIRKILNFGHTIGHAIESSYLDHNIEISHGDAIVMGMICENYIAYLEKILDYNDLLNINTFLIQAFFLKKIPHMLFDKIMNLMLYDKKNTDNINFTFINTIGKAIINKYTIKDNIKKSLLYYNDIL